MHQQFIFLVQLIYWHFCCYPLFLGFDCGVYTIVSIALLSKGVEPVNYKHEYIVDYRKKLALSITETKKVMELSSDSSDSSHESDCVMLNPPKKGNEVNKDSALKAPSKATSTIVVKVPKNDNVTSHPGLNVTKTTKNNSLATSKLNSSNNIAIKGCKKVIKNGVVSTKNKFKKITGFFNSSTKNEKKVFPRRNDEDDNELVNFNEPNEAVKMLKAKYHYSCDLCPSNTIDEFNEKIHEITNDEINNFSKLMNDAISKKSQTGSVMKDKDLVVITSKTLMNLSATNSMNLDYFVVVNSKKLLEASYRFTTNDKYKNHVDYCHYLLLFVRHIYYNNNHSIKPNNDKMLIGLSLYDTYMKHKDDKSLDVFSKYFRHLTNYDGTTNINHLTIWFYWMVDNMTLSIAVMDTKRRSVMLYVPKYDVKLAETINATLKDIDKMMEWSLEGHGFSACKIKEASNNNIMLDCELHKANYIIYISLEMIYNNKFSMESFSSNKNNMDYDHLLVRRCMFNIICFSVLGSMSCNTTLNIFERNPMLTSIKSDEMNSFNVGEKLAQFHLLCAEIEKNAANQTLC